MCSPDPEEKDKVHDAFHTMPSHLAECYRIGADDDDDGDLFDEEFFPATPAFDASLLTIEDGTFFPTVEPSAVEEGLEYMDHFRNAMSSVGKCPRDNGIDKRNVLEVVPLGGSTHTPKDADTMPDLKRKIRGKDLAGNQHAIRRWRSQCERAKGTLSSFTQATIEIDLPLEGVDLSCSFSHARFKELHTDHFRSAMSPVGKCPRDSGIDKRNVLEVVPLGGSTRTPKDADTMQDLKHKIRGKDLAGNQQDPEGSYDPAGYTVNGNVENYMWDRGGPGSKIISKIENEKGLKNTDAIIDRCNLPEVEK